MYSMSLTLRKDGNAWTLEGETSEPALAAGTKVSASLELDVRGASQLPVRNLDEMRAYGRMLGEAIFVGDIRAMFHEVLGRVPLGDALHVSLSVEDVELRSLRWERLCCPLHNRQDSPWEFLHLFQKTAYSLDLRSAVDRRYPAISRVGLKALVVVADMGPTRPYKLAEFNATDTVAGIRAALGKDISCCVLACSGALQLPDADGLPTLDEICRWLTRERFAILHLVCHGEFKQWEELGPDGKPVSKSDTFLYLRKPGEVDPTRKDDHVARVSATELLHRLRQLQSLPHLTFLCSCSSASAEAELGLGGLGQRLVRELAMPAVVAMTEPVPIDLATEISREFYNHLRQTGEVDRALTKASASQAGRPAVLVPTHFSRLAGRRLFDDNLELTAAEWEHGLNRLPALIQERAPVLAATFEKLLKIVQPALEIWRTSERSDKDKRTEDEKQAGSTLLARKAELNELCEDFLENSFDHLAKGKELSFPNYDGRCPFPGLGVFDKVKTGDKEEDFRPFFFGRDLLISEIRELLNRNRFVAVLGGSGSGKSSLIRAGLLKELRREKPELQAIVFPPGKDPLVRLQTELAAIPNPDILVVDQFEELFTLCTDLAQRKEFLKQLLPLKDRIPIVITMRADFLGECAGHDDLHQLLDAADDKHLKLIQPLKGNELRSVVELQAQAVGLKFEPGLAATIFDDLEGEPGAMPLLQHCLRQLWQYRHGRWLRLAEYANEDRVGGVKGAIARTAEDVYQQLVKDEPEASTLLPFIFERLARIDTTATDPEQRRDTRRREELSELTPAGSDAQVVKRIITKLADAKLVVTTQNPQTHETEVEVAHEALIRNWPRLQKWLDAARDTARLVERIRSDADTYRSTPSRDNLTLRGAVLVEAERLFDAKPPRLSESDIRFIQACRVEESRQRDRDLNAARQATKAAELEAKSAKTRMWASVTVLTLAAVAFLATMSSRNARSAERARTLRLTTNMAISLRDRGQLVKSALLFERAAELEENATRSRILNLSAQNLVHSLTFTKLVAHPRVEEVKRLPKSSQLISYSEDGTIYIQGKNEPVIRLPVGHSFVDFEVGLQDDILCCGTDGIIRLLRADTGQVFSTPSSRVIGARSCLHNSLVSWTNDGAVEFRNASNLAPRSEVGLKLKGELHKVTISKSGTYVLAFSGDEYAIWSGQGESYSLVARMPCQASEAMFIGEDQIALLRTDGKLERVSIATEPTSSAVNIPNSIDQIYVLAGEHFAARTVDGNMLFWKNANLLKPPITLQCQPQFPDGIVFDPKSAKSLTWSSKGTLFLWKTFEGKRVAEVATASIEKMKLMDNGRVLSWGGSSVSVWNLDNGDWLQKEGEVIHSGQVTGAEVSAGELVSWSRDVGEIKISALNHGFPLNLKDMSVQSGVSLEGGDLVSIRRRDESSFGEIGHWKIGQTVEYVPHPIDNAVLEGISRVAVDQAIIWSRDASIFCFQNGKVTPLPRISTSQGSAFSHRNFRVDDIRSVQNSQLLALGSLGVYQLDLGSTNPKWSHLLAAEFEKSAISPDGETIAAIDKAGYFRLWSVSRKADILTKWLPETDIKCIKYSRSGQHLAIVLLEKILLCDVKNRKMLPDLIQVASPKDIFVGNKKALIWSANDVHVVDLVSGAIEAELQQQGVVEGACFLGDEQFILSWGHDKSARLWDVTTAELLISFPHSNAVKTCDFRSDELGFYSIEENGSITVWDFSKIPTGSIVDKTGFRINEQNQIEMLQTSQ